MRYYALDTSKFVKFLKEEFMASGMTKTQLTRHLAEKLELNNKTAAAFLEHLADLSLIHIRCV